MSEGFTFIRLTLVASSLSPVFLLWAIRGVEGVPGELWGAICLLLFVFPNALLKFILFRARKSDAPRRLTVTKVEDHREQLVTYLLAISLPLIEVSFTNVRDAIAGVASLLFTFYLFYEMGLHYMNLFFTIAGYRLFEVTVAGIGDTPAVAESGRFVVLTRRRFIDTSKPLQGYRLGGNVLMELSNATKGVSV